MGCILIGIIICVLLSIWEAMTSLRPGLRSGVGILTLVVGIVIGFGPVSGYHEFEETRRLELISLPNSIISVEKELIATENSIPPWVKLSDSSTIWTISDNNITIVEDNNYQGVTLVVYDTKPKKSFWTFALGPIKQEYVFYVPTGAISRNVSLG